jgi:hypothetical protein
MRETLSKRPRVMAKTKAKTKIAETRTQPKLRPVPKSKTASAPKSSARSAAKAKTVTPKPAKTTQKAVTGKRPVGRPRKNPVLPVLNETKKNTLAKTAAKPSESSLKTKVKEVRVREKVSVRTKARAESITKPPVKHAKPANTIQPGKASTKVRRKIVLPIKIVPPPPAPPRRVMTAGALRAFEHAVRVFNRRHFDEAKPMFENLLVKYPGEVEIIARTQMYLQVCNQKLSHTQSAPHNADELYDRGVYALNIGDFSQAKTFFEKALRLKPEEPYLLYSLAATHAQTGAMDQALDYLKRAFQIQPRYRTQALHDADFSGLRENKQFLELLGLASPFDLLQSRR